MTTTKKLIIAVVALSVALCCAVGGTLAWLLDVTDPVTNTFTYGDINITLTESEDLDLKMVPGNTIDKDPVVTVLPDSEACYLFVKIEASAAVANYLDYDVDSAWKELSGVAGVYYMEVDAANATAGKAYSVLANDQVTVLESVTKEMMEAVRADADLVQLTFTAYAVQSDNVDSAAEAWAIANS